jgi:hypothetical protein
MEPKTVPHRPRSIPTERTAQDTTGDPALTEKLDLALGTVALFLDATKVIHAFTVGMESDEPDVEIVQRELGPKETAAYNAALDFLERYFDGVDREAR